MAGRRRKRSDRIVLGTLKIRAAALTEVPDLTAPTTSSMMQFKLKPNIYIAVLI